MWDTYDPPPDRMSNQPIAVLLIEDHDAEARMFQAMLAQEADPAFTVEHLSSLGAALERLARGRVEAVLLDLSLPDSQGLKTFEQLHRYAATMPVIILTGNDDKALALDAVRKGAQDYLVKGRLDGDVLSRVIRHAIERKRSEAMLKRERDQLQQLNKLLMGREERVLELKREVDELRRELGRDTKYQA